MATYLDRILERHREIAAADTRSLDDLVDEAAPDAADPTVRSGAADCGRRRRAGRHQRDQTPIAVEGRAQRRPRSGAIWRRPMRTAAASALSVLTDEEFFGGSRRRPAGSARSRVLPVLRKDFTVWRHDVCDARLMGADCVLLIAAASRARRAVRTARARRSRSASRSSSRSTTKPSSMPRSPPGATIVGVNQRDLVTFQVDHERAVRMAAAIPDHVVKVAESGVRGGGDARALQHAGYHAVLVGETLVTAADPAAALRTRAAGI